MIKCKILLNVKLILNHKLKIKKILKYYNNIHLNKTKITVQNMYNKNKIYY